MKVFFFENTLFLHSIYKFFRSCNMFRFAARRTWEEDEKRFSRKCTNENQVRIRSSEYSCNGSFHKIEQVSSTSSLVFGKIQFETHSKKMPHVAILKNSKCLFEKTHLILKKTPNFDYFENFFSNRSWKKTLPSFLKALQQRWRARSIPEIAGWLV